MWLRLHTLSSQSSAIYPIFRDMQDIVEEVFVLLDKPLGVLQSFLKIYMVPAAKRIAADLFEVAAPEIGEIFRRRKIVKQYVQNLLKQKQFENSREVENKNLSEELEKVFFSKK